jgi:hypothetical protein
MGDLSCSALLLVMQLPHMYSGARICNHQFLGCHSVLTQASLDSDYLPPHMLMMTQIQKFKLSVCDTAGLGREGTPKMSLDM